jgi:hypothetical protein
MSRLRNVLFVCIVMVCVVGLAVPGFADRKIAGSGIMAKDVLSNGGGRGENGTSGTIQSCIGQSIARRSGNLDLGILIGGYINAWHPAGGGQLVEEWTFDTGQGWTSAGVTGFTLPSYSGPSGGLLGMTGPGAGSIFGFWQTPNNVITYEPNMIFRARYALSRGSALTDPAAMPQIRLRWIANLTFAGSASYVISSIDPYSMVPPLTPATKEIRSYFYPAVATDLGITFDMIDFSADESGQVLLDRVVVEKIDRSTLGAATAVKTFDADFNTWEFTTNFFGAFGAISSSGSNADHIVLTSTIANAANAGFAQSPVDAMTYDLVTPHLYRATFTMSRGDADATIFPNMRLRALNEDNQISTDYTILHDAAPAQTPATTAYEVYWETPDLPASPTTGQDGFRTAYDMLDFGATEGDSAYLERLDVEYFAIPPVSGP